MSLTTPPKLRRLQEALYTKAKQEPDYRFYLLYDKVYRADILIHAYALSKQHGGAPGVDGVTFEDIEGEGTERWLAAVQEALRTGVGSRGAPGTGLEAGGGWSLRLRRLLYTEPALRCLGHMILVLATKPGRS